MGDGYSEMVVWMEAVARLASGEGYWGLEIEKESSRDTRVNLPLLVWTCRFGETGLGVVFVAERTKSCCWRWDGEMNV
jgi:hypothetical protein